jgi:ubiquinone/menaquinone biosynthesis C-methylase UbiE
MGNKAARSQCLSTRPVQRSAPDSLRLAASIARATVAEIAANGPTSSRFRDRVGPSCGMSFDALAPHYRWMEFVLAGNKLHRCRTAFLDRAARNSSIQNVLLVGEGNGRFLVECHRRLTAARIVCLDVSSRMLELSKQRLDRVCGSADRVEFVRGDVLAWKPPVHAFDLIVTHFFLDCFPPRQLEDVISILAAAAAPRATWLLADFQLPRAGFGKVRAALILRVMYLFFRVVTRLPARRLTEPEPFLKVHSFKLRERQVREWGLLRADIWLRGENEIARLPQKINPRIRPQVS